MADELIDARAMRCPWPALRLARAVRGAQPGAAVRLVADDPKAPDEIAQLARAQGWQLICEAQDGGWIFTVLR
jgi:tRNA 2-thiouridine synthesizing protein A